MKRTLVVGAGAIGRYLAALLADHGEDVTLLGRGETVRAIAARGLRIEAGNARSARVVALDAIEYRPGLAAFDTVFVCVKSHQLGAAAPMLATLARPGTALVFPQNGLPWWLFERCGGQLRGARLACLDPGGDLARCVDVAQVVGAVIYKSVQGSAPDAIRVVDLAEDRLLLGELDGTVSGRVVQIAARLAQAGLPAQPATDIRREKWRKLVTNVAWNAVCTLTGSTIAEVCRDPGTRGLCLDLMAETLRVARRLGHELDDDPAALVEAGAGKTAHVPSMLQDLRAGRRLEHAAIVEAVAAAGRLVHEPTPTIRTVAALLAGLDRGR